MKLEDLTRTQRAQYDQGKCVRVTYARSYPLGYKTCGKDIRPLEQGGDGFHCTSHLAALKRRITGDQRRQDKLKADRERKAATEAVIKELGLTNASARYSPNSRTGYHYGSNIVVSSRDLKQRFAEVWEEGFEAAADWIANNPGPSGNPLDPPRSPYAEKEN